LAPGEEKDALEAEIKSILAQPREEQGDQKIIRKEELQTYLDEGWKFLSTLDQQQVIVKKSYMNTTNLAYNSLVAKEKEKPMNAS